MREEADVQWIMRGLHNNGKPRYAGKAIAFHLFRYAEWTSGAQIGAAIGRRAARNRCEGETEDAPRQHATLL